MKIIEIKKTADSIYTVRIKPNWFMSLFGKSEYEEQFKDTGNKYTFGSGGVYATKDGSILGNGHAIGEAIDNFKRSW